MAGVKVYIGGLAYKSRNDSLCAHFENMEGFKDAYVTMEKEDPSKSRGFGFVIFDTSDQAREAIKEMHNTNLDGRDIRCEMAGMSN